MGIDGHCPKSETRFGDSRLRRSNYIASQICMSLLVCATNFGTGNFLFRHEIRSVLSLFHNTEESFYSIWADLLASC